MKRNRLYESILNESEDMVYVHFYGYDADSNSGVDSVYGANGNNYYSDDDTELGGDQDSVEPMPRDKACILAGYLGGFGMFCANLAEPPVSDLNSIEDLENLSRESFADYDCFVDDDEYEEYKADAVRIARELLSGQNNSDSSVGHSTVELITEKIPVDYHNC